MFGHLKYACSECYLAAYTTYVISIFHISHKHFTALYIGVRLCASPVVLAPLLSSGLALGRVVSTAEVWELVEHPILPCAHRGLDGELQSEEARRGYSCTDDVVHKYRLCKWRGLKTMVSEQPGGDTKHTGCSSNSFSPVRNCASCLFLQKRVHLFASWPQDSKQLGAQVKCGLFVVCWNRGCFQEAGAGTKIHYSVSCHLLGRGK